MNKEDSEEWGGWKIISDMLDRPITDSIYPTSDAYQKLYDFVMEQKEKARVIQRTRLIEEVAKMRKNLPVRLNLKVPPESHFIGNKGWNLAIDAVIERIKEI